MLTQCLDLFLLLQAVLLYPNGTAVAADKFQIVGGLATAKNGLVNFTSIRIYGDSQNQGTKSYLLQFSAVQPNTVLQPSYLNITVRGCVAGEEIVTDGPGGTLCTPCLSPSYSFLAAVRGCVKCDSTDHAVCSRSYKIPEEGYWHSHPRNPQVSEHNTLPDRSHVPHLPLCCCCTSLIIQFMSPFRTP